MSLFSQDLDKGGVLRDVVSIRNISYPSGKSLDTSIISARDTTRTQTFVDFPEFDTQSEWTLFPHGFNCNRGFIEYAHLFTKEVLNDMKEVNSDLDLRSLLTNSILRGTIETLFIPCPSSNIYTFQKPKDERYIYDYQWWRLVETSINDGLNKCIDPLWNYHIFVSSLGCTHSSHTFRCSFYVTIKLFGHRLCGDIFWPIGDDDRPGQLFRTIDPRYPSIIKQEVGSPVSISTRVDMEYIGVLDPKE